MSIRKTKVYSWLTSPLLPATIIIVVLLASQLRSFSQLKSLPSLLYVDIVSETNWSATHSSKLSLARAHTSGLLHRKVWVVPLDEMWQLGLSDASQEGCPQAMGAFTRHVLSGESTASTASELAHDIRRGRGVTELHALGKPFLLVHGSNREIVHAFALPVQGVFPRKGKKWFTQVIKPVDFVQHTTTLLMSNSEQAGDLLLRHFCSKEHAEWMLRMVAYALRLFHVRRLIPKSNPMDNVAFNDTLCCKADVRVSHDLRMCGIPCDQNGLYNIISYFPQTR
ncbi:hypothetical protein BWQ96_08196 [Gracilariopsis chorda]|uniref:Uncharacterized protein n=1 Tax=Gracilariopsis chorda TaxID=448386 RepID=A0A2V3ILU4_9FLOR|nr:hypothetical protein BWQ96_08196 [Gracilariopsis chorda]|eukprot:PXF42090.1 hypothetical protein BWQ96_08196 [Gracilariopsis chorda]